MSTAPPPYIQAESLRSCSPTEITYTSIVPSLSSPSLAVTSLGCPTGSCRATPPALPQTRVLATTDHMLITEQGTSRPAVASDAGETGAPEELPPSYDTARVSMTQIKYTFSPQTFNAMLLLPPAEAQDTRPIYHISIALNHFIPAMSITTIRRGGSEFGEYVAEFEMGSSELNDTISISGVQNAINNVISKASAGAYTWKWRLPDHRCIQFVWSLANGSRKTCTLVRGNMRNVHVAELAGLVTNVSHAGKPRDPCTITIAPAAYEQQGLVDHIILSALVTERMRLTKKT